jgi:hypothetical protein
VEYVDITSKLLLMTEENAFLNKRTIKNFAGNEDFKVKQTSPYGGTGYLKMIDRGNSDSDEEEPQDKPQNNPFSKAFEGILFRKIVIKNLSSDNLLMVGSIKSTIPEPNFEPANVEFSFEVKAESTFVITLKKHKVEEAF